MSSFGDLLRSALSGVCEVSDLQVAQLEAHYSLLLKWNRRLSLTTVTRLEEAVTRHYAESLFVAANLPEGEWSIVDVGSGPGFPGIPIGIYRPECQVTLVESVQKKAVFLSEASRDLRNIFVRGLRAEAVCDRFDWLVSRAVAWEQIPALALRFALLTGEPSAEMRGVRRIQLPWGRQRFLLIGDFPGS